VGECGLDLSWQLVWVFETYKTRGFGPLVGSNISFLGFSFYGDVFSHCQNLMISKIALISTSLTSFRATLTSKQLSGEDILFGIYSHPQK
jgi:hypothetical protein